MGGRYPGHSPGHSGIFLTLWIVQRHRRRKMAKALPCPRTLPKPSSCVWASPGLRSPWGSISAHPHQARRIVAALNLTDEDTVMEIGAGLGALTGLLAAAVRRVIALERDPELARFLADKLLAETPGVEVICQDVLDVRLPRGGPGGGPAPGGGGEPTLPNHLTAAVHLDLGRGGHHPGRAHDAVGGGRASPPRRVPRITGFCRSCPVPFPGDPPL